MTTPAESAPAPPRVVLDTNVVLDWLLFADPHCAALGEAIMMGRVQWLASPPMRAELEHVLMRGIASTRAGDPAAVLDGWSRWSVSVEPWQRPSERGLRCTDSDDQKFIDLALQCGASALLSRDRAVLKLARRAAARGLAIVAVHHWRGA